MTKKLRRKLTVEDAETIHLLNSISYTAKRIVGRPLDHVKIEEALVRLAEDQDLLTIWSDGDEIIDAESERQLWEYKS